ncbi:MAG: sensor histidine kinase [Clostridia bacterium]|nr:sensor histidine kinase [Clostridia bacterium]
MQSAFRNTALLGYFEPLQLLNKFLLLLLFFAAVYDFVMQIVRRNAEIQALALQNRYANEHAEHLRRSLDETRTMRHEMHHHIDALQGMIAGGDMTRAADYIRSLGGDFCAEPTRYTDHALINALVSSCAQKAKILGAEFEASVQVPEVIDIDDTDLAVLLSNMIDNALEAVVQVPDKKDRRLHLTAAIFENTGLFISCTNTFAEERKVDDEGNLLSTKAEEGHGLGLKAMHRVAEKYNNILLPEIEGNTFHVKTYLYFKK